MTAITARVAGVKNIIVASPKPALVTLAAGHVAKADLLIAIGGAQVISCLAYGTKGVFDEIIPYGGVDIIVGPGNKYVTAAKQIVSGICAIDFLAGPSECLVIADKTADESIIAADLLAQSEHANDAVPILVTTDKSMIKKVQNEIVEQLKTLTTAETAKKACENGYSIYCENIEQAIEYSNKIGPEHLEVMTENPEEISKKLNNYGGLFIGKNSAEVFGDYGAGPNHVLPTSGTSRYTGGLSVFSFLRIRTWLNLQQNDEQQQLALDTAKLARLEGLEGHARSAEKRLNNKNKKQKI